MNVLIEPGPLCGKIAAIPSKSHLHRLLICWALGSAEVFVPCRTVSEDIEATARCLNALGANIGRSPEGFHILPSAFRSPERAALDCGESGSTYRFLVPLVCALGLRARFALAGRLSERPMEELRSALRMHGAVFEGAGTRSPAVSGPVTGGIYEIPGGVSSQYISGLLIALPLLGQSSEIVIVGEAQSKGYIRMTLDVLESFKVKVIPVPGGYAIPGGQSYAAPEMLLPEGDWSNASFWLCAAAAGAGEITVTGLDTRTSQGDSRICDVLARFGAGVEVSNGAVTVRPGELRGIAVDAGDIPDLVPAIAVAAAAARGETVITNAGRLRHKESDRISAVCAVLRSLGGEASEGADNIIIRGRGALAGGTADSCGDHRIAMMAAVASVICKGSVKITNAGAVNKSYPGFFEDLASLGGQFTKEDY